MKTKIISIIMTIIASSATLFAEDAMIGRYHCGDGSAAHHISIRVKDSENKIDCVFVGVSSTMGNGYYRIDYKNLENFVTALKLTREKFSQWSEQAKANGVTKYSKEFDASYPKVTTYLSGKASFNFTQKPQALFKVEDGVPQIWIHTSTRTNMTQFNNQKELFYIRFGSVDDIDELISLLDNETEMLRLFNEAEQEKSKIDGLFE